MLFYLLILSDYSFQPSSEQGIRQCLIVAAIKIGDILFVHQRVSDLA